MIISNIISSRDRRYYFDIFGKILCGIMQECQNRGVIGSGYLTREPFCTRRFSVTKNVQAGKRKRI